MVQGDRRMNRRTKKHLKTNRDCSKTGRNAVQVRLNDLVKTEEVQQWLDKKAKKYSRFEEKKETKRKWREEQ